MKTLNNIFFILFLLTSIKSDIIKLDDDNFNEILRNTPVVMVDFYITGCVNCQSLEQELIKADKEIIETKLPVTIAQVECKENGIKVCKQYNVTSFPLIKFFNFGDYVFDYEGNKNSDDIMKYLKYKLEPGSKEIKNLDEFSAFTTGLDNVLIGFFEKEGSDLEKEFFKLADSLKADYKFAHTYSNKIMSRFGFRNDLVLFRASKLQTSLEQIQIKFEDIPRLYNMRNWITRIYHGLVGIRNPRNTDQFKAPLLVAYMNLDFSNKSSNAIYIRNRLIMAARKFTKHPMKITFAISDAESFKFELQGFGIFSSKDIEMPFIVARDGDHNKYIFNKTFSSESVEEFVREVLAGKQTAYIRSDSVPIIDNSLVKIVVGANFAKVLNDNKNDVILQLYSQGSSSCLTAINKLETVAKKLINDSDIIFAKMDLSSNEAPHPYVIRGFPSIYFAKIGQKSKPIFFEASHEVNDYIKFIAKHSSKPLIKYDREGNTIKTKKNIKTEL